MATSRRTLSSVSQHFIRERADWLCEYCHANERWQYVTFTIDHVISLSKGGTDDLDNLALACFHCNRQKSNYRTGIDPETGVECDLFNPRVDLWGDHFVWSADKTQIVALTATGRATIIHLRLNRERVINIRLSDVVVGRHPPDYDPVMDDD